MKNIAVFASGFGSNFEAFVEAINQNRLHANIVLLVSDKPASYAVERANKHHISTFVFNPKDYSSKAAYETLIVEALQKNKVDLIILAGYMRLVGDVLLQNYRNRIINIHPALLPAFPGTHAIEKAYQYGVKIFGVTVHYVDEGMDTGTIIDQDSFKKEETDTVEEVETKIHALEHRLYPKVIESLLNS